MRRLTILLLTGLAFSVAVSFPISRASAQQAAVVTDDNLNQMITDAKTPADHEAIATYYDQEAAKAQEKADLHRRSAASYRKANLDKPVGMAKMCDGIAAMWDKVAADARELAKSHRDMAKKAGAGS